MEEALKYFESLNEYYKKVACIDFDKKETIKFIDRVQLTYAKVAFMALDFIYRKEEIVENKGNMNYELLVNGDELNDSLCKLATKNKDGYKLGGVQFKDAAEIICFIRNKFAHGAYKINTCNNSIIMKKDNQDVEMNIDKLADFVMPLTNFLDMIKNDKIYVRNTMRITFPKNINSIKSKQEYINTLNNIDIFNFTFTKKSDKIFNHYEKSMIEYFISEYRKTSAKGLLYEPKEIEDEFNVNFHFATLKVKKCKTTDLNEKPLLEKLYDGNKKIFDKMDFEPQLHQMSDWIDEFIDDSSKKNLISRGCLINSICCREFKKGILSIKKCKEEYKTLINMPLSSSETKRISALLAMFYSVYIYPLEHKYMDDFDYGKFNLDFLKPDTVEYRNIELEQLTMQLSGINKDRNKLNEEFNKIQSNINGIENSEKMSNEDKIIKLKNLRETLSSLDIKRNQIDITLQVKQSEYNELLNELNSNEKYYHNKTIIEYIRNAMAHGNVKIQKTGQNGKENLLFVNEYEGKIYLDLIVSVDDFKKLFSEENINVLKDNSIQKIKDIKH